MTKEEDKKSFWEKFFGIEEIAGVEVEVTQEDDNQGKKIGAVAPPPPAIKEKLSERQEEEKDENQYLKEEIYDSGVSSEEGGLKAQTVYLDIEPKKEIEISPDKYFYVFGGGPSVKGLQDLHYYLGTITERQFWHHVGEGKNDFANWVRDVLKENRLAIELCKTEVREEMIDIIKKFLDSN